MTLNQTESMVTALLTVSFAVLGLTFLLGANPNALIATFNFYSLDTVLSESALGAFSGIALNACHKPVWPSFLSTHAV